MECQGLLVTALTFNTEILTALGLASLFFLDVMLTNMSVPCYASSRNPVQLWLRREQVSCPAVWLLSNTIGVSYNKSPSLGPEVSDTFSRRSVPHQVPFLSLNTDVTNSIWCDARIYYLKQKINRHQTLKAIMASCSTLENRSKCYDLKIIYLSKDSNSWLCSWWKV